MTNPIPTKSNLLAAKRSRDLAQTGSSLMDQKQAILSRELLSHIEQVNSLQSQMECAYQKAYSALQRANIALGQCENWAETVEEDQSLSLHYRSVMGLELPILTANHEAPFAPPYGFTGTDSSLDEALLRFAQVKALIRAFAERENTVYRLAQALGKSRKRARALDRVIIPRLDAAIRQMEEILAQRELEELSRQKALK